MWKVNKIYRDYKKEFFPKLLENPNINPEDKQKIRELLKKPWNPYIRRHSSLTEKSGILKEHHLRQFAGWSPGSNMHLKYLHYFGNESNDSILEAYGIIPKDKQRLSDSLRPKQCPQCSEPNKPDSRFCSHCRMVLTYDAYNETLEKQQEKESEIEYLKQQVEESKKTQSKVFNIQEQIDEIRKYTGMALGISEEEMDKTEVVLSPGVVDLDAEIMAEMNSKSKKEDNNKQ